MATQNGMTHAELEAVGFVFPEDDYVPAWATDEMRAGTETVREHLVDDIHGIDAGAVARLSWSECYRLHDELHAMAGHDLVLELLELLENAGFERGPRQLETRL